MRHCDEPRTIKKVIESKMMTKSINVDCNVMVPVKEDNHQLHTAMVVPAATVLPKLAKTRTAAPMKAVMIAIAAAMMMLMKAK